MRSIWFTRAGRAALATAMLVALAAVAPASAKPAPGRPAKRFGLNLFALTFGVMNVNRVFCGINNIGEICVDPTNSPVLGGGFWPKGTPDQYVFNSGLQLAGTIPASAGFVWAGDTVGAFFMDPRGTQAEGDPITLVFNSLDLGDAAAWPNGGEVRDTAIYNSVLIGRNSVSQQDLWVRTWDGNPAFTGNARSHPMGVLVEERGMAWNFPTGNEDILYFVYNFYNVTASNPAAYSGLDPAIQAEIAAIGADFQTRNEVGVRHQHPRQRLRHHQHVRGVFRRHGRGRRRVELRDPGDSLRHGRGVQVRLPRAQLGVPGRHLRRAVRALARLHRA